MTWLTGYTYRKKITITGQAGAGINYQVKLQIGNVSGGNFNLSGHAQSFPNDIRFTNSNSSTQLYYWIENVATTPITAWIKVVDSLETNVDIYCYYGKVSDTTTSDGTNTFQFFDDFQGTSLDSTKWDIINSVSVSIANSIATITSYGTNTYIQSKTSFPINSSIRIKQKDNDLGCYHYPSEFGFGNRTYPISTNYVNRLIWTTSQSGFIIGDTAAEVGTGGWSNDYAWHTFDIVWTSSKVQLLMDGAQRGTDLTTHIPSVSLPAIAGRAYYVNCNNQQAIDWYLVRKYTSPEPTLSTAGTEELGITAYSMSLTQSETPCRTGICTVRADIVWQNLGSSSVTFRPKILIDSITSVQAASDTTIIGAYPATSSTIQITTPILSTGNHTICPDPN